MRRERDREKEREKRDRQKETARGREHLRYQEKNERRNIKTQRQKDSLRDQ